MNSEGVGKALMVTKVFFFSGKRLDNSEGRAGKHERHDLMVHECNESLRFEWNDRHMSLYLFQQRPATESLAAFGV
jgi:hypothetical protein